MSKEIIQTILNLLVALVSLGFTWLIGHRLTTYWTLRQKRKELELAAAERFYDHYGEFFSVWKLWEHFYIRYKDQPEKLESCKDTLLERVSKAEAGIEATILKIVSERVLTKTDIDNLGNLRQAFQLFRQSIRDMKPLPWKGSEDKKYREFKRLSCHLGTLLSSGGSYKTPSNEEATAALTEITSNKFKKNWKTPSVDL